MNQYRRNLLILILIFASLSGASYLGPKKSVNPKPEAPARPTYATPWPASFGLGKSDYSGLRQYAAAGHVLGFQKGGVVIATESSALRVEFVDARPVMPSDEECLCFVKGKSPEKSSKNTHERAGIFS